MEKLKLSHNVSVRWRSYELRPAGSPPMPEAYRKRIEEGRPRLYAIARETYGLDMNPGPMGQNTRMALIAAKYAEHAGKGEAFHARLMHALWTQQGRVDDEAALIEHALALGIDAVAFKVALIDPVFEVQVRTDLQQARDYGLEGVPALVFNNRYLVSGAQPYEALKQAVEKIQAG